MIESWGSNRVLLDGTMEPQQQQVETITIHTRCPGKWLFFDRETGEIWSYKEGHFGLAPSEALNSLVIAVWAQLAAVLAARTVQEQEPEPNAQNPQG